MRKFLLIVFVFPLLLFSQRTITLEDVWLRGTFNSKGIKGFNVLKNGTSYVDFETATDGSINLSEYDLKTGQKIKILVVANEVKMGNKLMDISNYEFSSDESKLLISENPEAIYRHSIIANYFVYDIEHKFCAPLSVTGKQMFPTFSPDNNKVAFIRDNNLWYKNLLDGNEVQVSKDGEWNKIKNGWADWVYEEEFQKMTYFTWSANNQYLAYVKFNESQVKEFSIDFYKGDLYPNKYSYKYPKAGEDNSVVSLHIYDCQSKNTLNVNLGAEIDYYLPRIQFTNDPSILCVQKLNRLQNKLEYLFVNASDGKSRLVLVDESKTYVNVSDDLTFIKNKGFIISSEKDNYNHLYYYDLDGKLIQQITKGEWDVTQFKGYSESTNTLYYVSTENGAINRDVYSIKLDGKSKKRLSNADGFSDITLTKGYKYYILNHSSALKPPVFTLHQIDGATIKVLEDNKALNEELKYYNLSKKEFFKIKTSEGISLNAWMMKPDGFDSTKKYPVYMYCYGGPGSALCKNAWMEAEYFWHNILTQQGYIVVCVDGRGTAGQGRLFKHSTYLQLGKLEVTDQIEAAKYFGKLKYVDKSRIGFQGWSYGGYMAALMISKGASVIKSAIAVAPVSNWKYYDNIYTERFLRKPSENPSGYEDNSPVNFVKQIKGKFLLIHGSADDNVHMQNSMELANALVNNNIPFDFMIYPNRNHGIRGGNTRLHIYSKILKFVLDNI